MSYAHTLVYAARLRNDSYVSREQAARTNQSKALRAVSSRPPATGTFDSGQTRAKRLACTIADARGARCHAQGVLLDAGIGTTVMGDVCERHE
eukprot:4610087-Pleurochrysis_carterae.AAC.1